MKCMVTCRIILHPGIMRHPDPCIFIEAAFLTSLENEERIYAVSYRSIVPDPKMDTNNFRDRLIKRLEKIDSSAIASAYPNDDRKIRALLVGILGQQAFILIEQPVSCSVLKDWADED